MFRLHKALFTQIVDSFQFKVSVPGDQTVVHEFSIRYDSLHMRYNLCDSLFIHISDISFELIGVSRTLT